METPKNRPVIEGLHKAYSECNYIQKKGTAPQYKFAGEAQFIETLRPILIKYGIIVYQSGCKVIVADGYETTNKSGQQARTNRVVAEYEFTFAHTSGDAITVTAVGEGTDTNGDKSAYKANTGALKYALRQTLLIETGNDPDESGKHDKDIEKFITPAQKEALIAALGGPGDRVAAFCHHNGLGDVGELAASSFDAAMAQIKAANDKRKAA